MSIQIDPTKQRTEHAHVRHKHAAGPSWIRRRALIIGAAVAAAVAALLIVLNLGSLGNVSIVSGWFPVFLFWVTVAFCVVAVATRRHLLREFAIGIPIGIGFTVVLFGGLAITQAIPAGAPRSMYVWLIVTCLVAGLILAGWRRAGWLRRIVGVGAVGLCVLSAGSVANQAFQYYPTFDRLLGKTANNFIDNAQLDAIRKEVAKTGVLPDHGATLSVTIPGRGLKFTPRQAYVWVPPAWFAPSRPQLPVIELLHGGPGQPSDWTRASYADATSLAFAKQHNGVAPILVMPDVNDGGLTADSECVNSAMFGQVETYLTKAVPEYMQKNFNARTRVGSFAIAGLSEGGTCAAGLALNNPKEYPVFANYSGLVSPQYNEDTQQQTIDALFGGSLANFNAHNPLYLLAHNRYNGMSGWFEAGQQDPVSVQAAHTLQGLAANAGIDTCVTTPPGKHNFAFFTIAFQNSLPWLSWKLKLTPEPSSIAAQCAPGKS
jgi:S-formylglutathione hydrolase FrmB